MKIKCFRHGEIIFKKIKSLPKELKASKTNIIAKGSHGNDHTFKGGTLYLLPELKDFTFGYLKANKTILYHSEHGDKKVGGLKTAELPDGIYEIRKAKEYTPAGLVPIVD